MSERFRTQPITSAERLESDRYRRGSLSRSAGALQNHFSYKVGLQSMVLGWHSNHHNIQWFL